MKGKIILRKDNDDYLYDYNLSLSLYPFDFEITINTDLSENFLSLISTTGDLDKSIDINIELSDSSEIKEFYKKIKKNKLEILKNIEYISFDFSVKEIFAYINANPILKTKKIVFPSDIGLNLEFINEINRVFGSDTENLFFEVSDNTNLIGFQEYSATVKEMFKLLGDIEKFNFSPLEKIMYVYDIVRDRVYTEVAEGENKTDSRDLSSSLLGDKIVCLGYARIFANLLEQIGIYSREVILYNKDRTKGHARNEIYIKDDKYNIDGIYYFDPTFDSKRKEKDNSFLSSYKYFAMTKSDVDAIDKGEYIDIMFPYFSSDMMWELEEIVDEKGFEGLSKEFIRSINYMSEVINDKELINNAFLLPGVPDIFKPDKEKVIEELLTLVEYFDTPISANVFLEALYNVRKVQYYENPEKYPFGLNEFYKTILLSHWEFESDDLERFRYTIADLKEKAVVASVQLIKYSDDTNLYLNIERVKLARTLRKVYEKKQK